MKSIFFSLSLAFLCLMVCFVGSTASTQSIIFNATVAQDGTGDYTTVSEAVKAAPSFSQIQYYIRIKPGTYKERVEVSKDKTYIALIGDDVATTKITFDRTASDTIKTSDTATLDVEGEGFMAQFLTIENSAGPKANQSVALQNDAKYSVLYKCVILGYQDTLYIRGINQFYKDCDIYGTVDFIFGDGKAVFQGCRAYAHFHSEVTVTAQSRESLDEDSGFSFQDCTVTVAPEARPVRAAIKAYLGRPWRNYSTVIFLESFLDDIVDPSGWTEFPPQSKDYAIYEEYKNWGPGADTSKRINWKGYKVIKDRKEAEQFTVAKFIDGDNWLPKTGVPYVGGLINKH